MPGNRYLLVLTACIDPSAGDYPIQRSDPLIRRGDYEQALRFWLQLNDARVDKILFIENSGSSLDSLRAIVATENALGKRVEFVSLDCNGYPEGTHYGYAELRMLDLGLRQSQLRRETTHMIKATGRLTFPSLSRLLDRVPEGFDFMADARHWRTPWKRHRQPFITTQLILFSHAFYAETLQTRYDEMLARRRRVELYFHDRLVPLAARGDPGRQARFPCNADPVGQPAHRGRSYRHPTQLAVNLLRAGLRRLAPGWWL